MMGPEIIFADEPTGALNQTAASEVMEAFIRMNIEGTTVLMVTHDSRVAAICERILYILDGEIRGELKLGKYAEGDSRAAESKSAVGDSSSFETESVLSDAEASAWDNHFEEAGMSGHEESAGAEYSEEQTCAPESCGEDTATGYELSDVA